ncbi:putative translation factor pelota [Methanococcus vannielii SB]|jgi:protein pelota|uniref:Protein pelota homolog n=1 Tax=Methanococcus vannielii (strain ATCC 35089 / DSM 1224 / JCM 13029 / OCM 148 / SB) TaxID=406327 RepID=PELO_METVS|nr:mRNA surveillance protein pelota [Methanococcus vannielii]A6UR75.1 RecName: Full=Protein pelota homolog [Methanococcus vannielii SB]ABR54997.1 putative translation factor pelota [Methanococcus vannielii SB]
MKIIQEIPEKNIIKVMPENLDDLWHLSHIVQAYNAVYSVTERRTEDKGDKLRADRGTKRRVFLGIKVEKVSFHEEVNRLRVSGKIIHAPEDIPIGSYHTLDIEPFTQISIQKNWKKWDLTRLKEAEESGKRPKVVVVILDDSEADIFTVRDFGVKELASIKSGVSKRIDSKQNEQAKYLYYNEIITTLSEFDGKILFAGPGFSKNNIQNYISEKHKDLASKIVIESTNHTGRLGLSEILKSGIIDRIYGEARLSKESQIIEKLLEEISKKRLASYGLNSVKNSINYSAVETLLITDEFLRRNRSTVEEMVNSVENSGGKFVVISTEHDSGRQLKALGGISALLRFPVE